MNMVKIKKFDKNAIIPKRATEFSAGYDLYANLEEDFVLNPQEKCIIPTGIGIELPENTAGMIYTRSGLGIKFGVHVSNGVGVIDSDYRGEIKVGLHNLSHEAYTIKPFERIAQLVIQPVLSVDFCEVSSLGETVRNVGGLGSSGKK